MFDPDKLKERLRRVMIETVTDHNRATVQLNRAKYLTFDYYWGERSSKSTQFLAYASWERDFREAVEAGIESVVEKKLADRLISGTNIDNALAWVSDAEFALRAQVSRTLLWGLSLSLQSLPRHKDNCWYAGTTKNGYLIKLRDPDKPTESEFGRYVVGRRDGRFLCFANGEGWKVHEFDLRHVWPVNVRPARNTEIYFDQTLDDVAKQLADVKIKSDPYFQYPYRQWEELCTPQYALPL
jgi:hypothetical protein